MKEAREKAEEELMEKENTLQKKMSEHEKERKRLEEKHQQEVNECHFSTHMAKEIRLGLIFLTPPLS